MPQEEKSHVFNAVKKLNKPQTTPIKNDITHPSSSDHHIIMAK